MTKLEQELQDVLNEQVSELDQMGNGYGWTVKAIMEEVFPVLQKHINGFNPNNITIDNSLMDE